MTNQNTPDPSRRRVLASVGALGVGVLGSSGLGLQHRVTSQPWRYTHYTYAATPETGVPQLKIAWYSTYNGSRTEPPASGEHAPVVPTSISDNETTTSTPTSGGDDRLGEYVADVDGPLFAEQNVLPGDFGTASIGLFVEGEQPVRIRLRPVVDGALAEIIDVKLGYDTGFFGIGACDGAEVPADIAGDVEMSLAAFGEAYGGENGLLLTPDCLAPDEQICLTFAWEIDAAVANEWQNASVAFELAFVAEGCSL